MCSWAFESSSAWMLLFLAFQYSPQEKKKINFVFIASPCTLVQADYNMDSGL